MQQASEAIQPLDGDRSDLRRNIRIHGIGVPEIRSEDDLGARVLHSREHADIRAHPYELHTLRHRDHISGSQALKIIELRCILIEFKGFERLAIGTEPLHLILDLLHILKREGDRGIPRLRVKGRHSEFAGQLVIAEALSRCQLDAMVHEVAQIIAFASLSLRPSNIPERDRERTHILPVGQLERGFGAVLMQALDGLALCGALIGRRIADGHLLWKVKGKGAEPVGIIIGKAFRRDLNGVFPIDHIERIQFPNGIQGLGGQLTIPAIYVEASGGDDVLRVVREVGPTLERIPLAGGLSSRQVEEQAPFLVRMRCHGSRETFDIGPHGLEIKLGAVPPFVGHDVIRAGHIGEPDTSPPEVLLSFLLAKPRIIIGDLTPPHRYVLVHVRLATVEGRVRIKTDYTQDIRPQL